MKCGSVEESMVFLMVGFCEHIDHLNAINKIILKSTSERHFWAII